jgi:hypothetical protein
MSRRGRDLMKAGVVGVVGGSVLGNRGLSSAGSALFAVGMIDYALGSEKRGKFKRK